MRIVLAAPIALGLVLAACGETGSADADADGDGVISAEEMSSAVADREPMQPGNYQLSMEVLELEDPDSSPEELQQARAFFEMMGSMAPPQCMTEEDLNGGMMDVAESMQSGDCEITSLNTSGSDMNAEMSCQSDGGGRATTRRSAASPPGVPRRRSTLPTTRCSAAGTDRRGHVCRQAAV